MSVAIVGGGITGLSCAYYLGQAGLDATVFDPAPGGLIGTEYIEGCALEAGPESWLAQKPAAAQLIRELGLGNELQGSNDAQRKTYILRRGRFLALPDGLQLVVPTKVRPLLETPLFNWATKIRMGLEVFRSPKILPDRSVAEFVRDHFGAEVVDYLAEPLLSGVYGGSTERLSAPSVLPRFVEYEQRYGSLVVGSLRQKCAGEQSKEGANGGAPKEPVFLTLKRGMGTLTDELKQRVRIIRAKVDAVGHDEHSWGVRVGGDWQAFKQVVLACGANHAAGLCAPHDASLGALLESIPHSGSDIWTFIFQRGDVPHPLDAFGFLVPRPERKSIVACTWVGTKWPGRVPSDKAVLRCFSTEEKTREEQVLAELGELMGIRNPPIRVLHHHWPLSMPQYTVGHTARVLEIDARIEAIPGLYLAGNAYRGVGIPDCIRSAREAAASIVDSAASLTHSV